MEEKGICVLCGGEYDDYGNNPEPLAHEGRCCRKCNEKVIEARVEAMKTRKQAEQLPDVVGLDVAEATHIGFAAYMALSESVMCDKTLEKIYSASTSLAEGRVRRLMSLNKVDLDGREDIVASTAKSVAITTILLILMSDEDCGAVKDMRELLMRSGVKGDAE